MELNFSLSIIKEDTDVNNKNPLKDFIDAYKDNVKECDKSGYEEDFKRSFELFCDSVNRELDEITLHFENIEYLDGYFFFAMGTNSVVHFHIRECPGWLFGVWWKVPNKSKKEKTVSDISGEFFAQFEETVDKFKPSRSTLCETIKAHLEEKNKLQCTCWKAAKIINFIMTEPHLAFCRDYYEWDYYIEYHTREEAEEKYLKYCESRDQENQDREETGHSK